MAEAKDIRAAIEMMARDDKTLWDAHGNPKVEKLSEMLGEQITKAAVTEAIGWKDDEREDDTTKAPAVPAADVVKAAVVPDPATLNVDRIKKDDARSMLEAARAAHAEVSAKIAAKEEERQEAVNAIDDLVVEKDKQAKLIEKLAPRVSDADAVKAIQKQTTDRLAAQKQSAAAAEAVLRGTGTAVFPSKLDQSMAMRKKTPEQVSNYAKFVHQNAGYNNEARG